MSFVQTGGQRSTTRRAALRSIIGGSAICLAIAATGGVAAFVSTSGGPAISTAVARQIRAALRLRAGLVDRLPKQHRRWSLFTPDRHPVGMFAEEGGKPELDAELAAYYTRPEAMPVIEVNRRLNDLWEQQAALGATL